MVTENNIRGGKMTRHIDAWVKPVRKSGVGNFLFFCLYTNTYGDVVVKVESEESLDLDKNEKVPIEQSSPPLRLFCLKSKSIALCKIRSTKRTLYHFRTYIREASTLCLEIAELG